MILGLTSLLLRGRRVVHFKGRLAVDQNCVDYKELVGSGGDISPVLTKPKYFMCFLQSDKYVLAFTGPPIRLLLIRNAVEF